MRALFLVAFALVTTIAAAQDLPLIPEALNRLLPRVTVSMKKDDVKKLLSSAFPSITDQALTTGTGIGDFGFRLDEHSSLLLTSDVDDAGRIRKEVHVYYWLEGSPEVHLIFQPRKKAAPKKLDSVIVP